MAFCPSWRLDDPPRGMNFAPSVGTLLIRVTEPGAPGCAEQMVALCVQPWAWSRALGNDSGGRPRRLAADRLAVPVSRAKTWPRVSMPHSWSWFFE